MAEKVRGNTMRSFVFVGILVSLFALVAFDVSAGEVSGDKNYEATEQSVNFETRLLDGLPTSAKTNQSVPLIKVAQCCKICRKGKACGNSCISKKYTCRKPPGCACDG